MSTFYRYFNIFKLKEEIFEALGVDYSKFYCGALGKFLKEIKMNGNCKWEYKIPKLISHQVHFEEIKFVNHKEFDKMVQKIIDCVPNFDTDYPSDWTLLKAFDRY